MTNFPVPDVPLPTLDRLGVASLSASLDPKSVATDWLTAFSAAATNGNVDALSALLLPGTDTFWRDMLALTWNIRTFRGQEKIKIFLSDRLALSKPHDFKLRDQYVTLEKPLPNVVWISLMFDFATPVGKALSITRLVPIPNGEWKAHVVFTNLESLTNFPEKIGQLRSFQPNHGRWESVRTIEAEFFDKDPPVLIIGGGSSGLDIATRLKLLSVPSLIVERNARIGDNWRNRYEGLCLHDIVWSLHMPYLPFPPSWPVYIPTQKYANWLEFYAETMELNIWTSSTITQVNQEPATNKWHVTIKRGDGTERKLVVNHVVFCTGLSSGTPNIPTYPGMDGFKGQILHSSQHKRASDHAGKKVVVVGAGSSAHGIAMNYQQNGVDVTMFQRGSTYVMSVDRGWEVIMKGSGYWESGPPVEIIDRISASYPIHMIVPLKQVQVKYIAELDKEILDGLHKVGFRTNLGIKDTGFTLLTPMKAGGYHLDMGASKLIAEGKIKLKSDSTISSFIETGIKFENGTELPADVVVFATGFANPIGQIRNLCGEEVAKRCKPIWGLDDEGEINGLWRDLGIPGLWMMLGGIALCRFHSSHIALQIKAIEEGIMGSRYEA